MDVPEGGGEQVAAALARAERRCDAQEVFGRRVEPAVLDAFATNVVLGAADHAALDFEHHAGPRALRQQLGRDAQVLLQRQRRAVEHVRVEQRWLTVFAPSDRFSEQRSDERVELIRRAVVGVEGDQDAVAVRDLMSESCQSSSPALAVAHSGAGYVRCAAGGQFHNPVGFGVGKAAQRGIQGLGGADVDRRVRVAAGRSGVEHVRVLLGIGNAHTQEFPRVEGVVVWG
jgi:hypothetical protein